MLLAPPRDLVGFKKALNGLVEAETSGFLEPLAGYLNVTLRNRVLSLPNQRSVLSGRLSGRGKAHAHRVPGVPLERTETHFPAPSADRVSVDPALAAALADLEIQAATVMHVARLCSSLDLDRVQKIEPAPHR